MPQNPYAEFQAPAKAADPYAEFAAPVKTAAAAQKDTQGALSSFADSSGLSSLGNAILHPVNAAKGILPAIVAGAKDSVNNVRQAYNETYSNPADSAVHLIRALPGGSALVDKAADQYADKNYGGMVGTVAGVVAPYAIPAAIGAGAKAAGATARLASASGDSLKLAATRAIVPGDAGEVLTHALKPGVQYGADPATLLNKAVAPIVAQNPTIGGVADFAAAADQARDASNAVHQSRIARYRPLQAGTQGPTPNPLPISGVPVANAQMESVPFIKQIEQPAVYNPGTAPVTKVVNVPAGEGSTMTMGMTRQGKPAGFEGGIMNKTRAIADNYRRNFSVPDMDQLRQDANAELHAYYNKAQGDRAAALANPETARIKAVGDSIRENLYPAIEADQGLQPGTVAANQEQYGTLADVGDIANKRNVVFSRHDPVSLAQRIALGHGGITSRITGFAVDKAVRGLTDSDALVRSAVDRFQNPVSTPIVPGLSLPQQSIFSIGNGLTGAGNYLQRSVPPVLAVQPFVPRQGR